MTFHVLPGCLASMLITCSQVFYTYFIDPMNLSVREVPLLELRREVRLLDNIRSALPAPPPNPATHTKGVHSPDLDAEGGYTSRDVRSESSSTECPNSSKPSFLGKNAIGVGHGSAPSGHGEVFVAAVVPTLRTEYKLFDVLERPGSKVKQQVLKLALERVD